MGSSSAACHCCIASQRELFLDMVRAGAQEGGAAAPQSKDTDAQDLHRDGTWPDRYVAYGFSNVMRLAAYVAATLLIMTQGRF